MVNTEKVLAVIITIYIFKTSFKLVKIFENLIF